MFWVLLSHVIPKSRNSFSPVSCSAREEVEGYANKIGREHSWSRWPKLIEGLFHSMGHHAHCINWGSYPEGGHYGFGNGVWHQSEQGKQLSCASLVWVFSFPSIIIITASITYHCYCILLWFQRLNCSYLNLQVLLLILLHIPQWGGGDSEWLSERLHGA